MDAVGATDVQLVMGVTLVAAVAIIGMNLLADIVVAAIDPRV